MAKIVRTLSAKTNTAEESEILFRFTLNRNKQLRIKSGLFVAPSRFKDGEIKKPRANPKEAEALTALETRLISIERLLITTAQETTADNYTKTYFEEVIKRAEHPEQYQSQPQEAPPSFFETYREYYTTQPIGPARVAKYKVLERALLRFEAYKRETEALNFTLDLNTFTTAQATEFYTFLAQEHIYSELYPEIYATIPSDTHKARKRPKQEQRGHNTIVSLIRCLRAFFNWAFTHGHTVLRPFASFDKPMAEKYVTPYYITQEERNIIANWPMEGHRDAAQRDIFIFQCLIGCRVSDLIRLTPADIVNGAVEYIPEKTKNDRANIVRVPLNAQAAALVEKYRGQAPDGQLFPFISKQKYNDAIKRIFTLCGITRVVTTLDTATGKEVKRPINEIASSHLARRTFVGNLYKQVRDPNLVGALSGHKEGSKAFARYRDIDEDIKKDLVNLLK